MSKETRLLWIFLAITFLWTWAFYAPLAIGQHNPYEMPWTICLIFGGMGPSLVGVVMVLLTADKEQRKDYFRRCFSVKHIGPLAWGMIVLLFPALAGVSMVISLLLGDVLPAMQQLTDLMANPVMWPLAAFISFMSGPWAEEFGWRGFTLDRLMGRFGTVGGTALLGLVWGVWHLPLFFMPATWHGQLGFGPDGFWMFIGYSVGLAFIMTWVYQMTGRSILTGMLLHFTSNFTGQLLAPWSHMGEISRSLLVMAVGLAIAVMMMQERQKQVSSLVCNEQCP